MKLLLDRVLLKKHEPEEKSSGGIVLTSQAEPKHEATVVAIGPGKVTKSDVLIPMSVKVGDKVIYNPTAGHLVTINGQSLLATTEEEILVILDN